MAEYSGKTFRKFGSMAIKGKDSWEEVNNILLMTQEVGQRLTGVQCWRSGEQMNKGKNDRYILRDFAEQ